MKKMNSKLWLLYFLTLTICGCATTSPKQEMTPLQIQAFQTREFEASKTIVFGSVVTVFQDLGYIVASADKETGFITADSAATNKTGFWQAMAGEAVSGKTRATAFVEEIRPDVVTVRLNFVDTQNISSAYGRESNKDRPILEPEPYQVAFERIEEAIFVRKGSR